MNYLCQSEGAALLDADDRNRGPTRNKPKAKRKKSLLPHLALQSPSDVPH